MPDLKRTAPFAEQARRQGRAGAATPTAGVSGADSDSHSDPHSDSDSDFNSDRDFNSDSDFDFKVAVGHLLRRAYQRHVAIFHEAMKSRRLTAAQFIVLCTVRDNDATSLSDIAKATAIDQATIRGVIDRLRSRGLVLVRRDPRDERKVRVSLSKKGLTATERAVPVVKEISRLTFDGLDADEQAVFLDLLRGMIDSDDGAEKAPR